MTFPLSVILVLGFGVFGAIASLTTTLPPEPEQRKIASFREAPVIEKAALDREWQLKGSNWHRHVWTSGISKQEKANETDNEKKHYTFSTCPVSSPPSWNSLRSPVFDRNSLRDYDLPAVLVAEFAVHISDTCIAARIPYCKAVELWLSEALPFDRTRFHRRLLFNGMIHLVGDNIYPSPKSNRTVPRPLTSAFQITRTPFFLEFHDPYGACLEIQSAHIEVYRCLMVKAVSSIDRPGIFSSDGQLAINSSTAATTENPTTTTTQTVTLHTKEELLAQLNCSCPPGFFLYKNKIECVSCPPSTFTHQPHVLTSCTPCPRNSETYLAESKSCDCFDHYFRPPGADATSACFSPPPPPDAATVSYLDRHTASANWSYTYSSENTTNVTYQVQCIGGCKNVVLNREWSGTGQSVLVELAWWSEQKRAITIRIYALNSVSGVAGPAYASFIESVIRLPRRSVNDTNDDYFYDEEPQGPPTAQEVFDQFIDVVSPLGAIGIVVGTIVSCCFIFCGVRMYQERDLRKKKPIKILGITTPTSSRRGSNSSNSESLRTTPKSRTELYLPANRTELAQESLHRSSEIRPLTDITGEDATAEDYISAKSDTSAGGRLSSLYATLPSYQNTYQRNASTSHYTADEYSIVSGPFFAPINAAPVERDYRRVVALPQIAEIHR